MTDLLKTYLADLSAITNRGDATEQSYYSTLKDLCRVATVLAETIKVQGEIDEVIERHGGWPISSCLHS